MHPRARHVGVLIALLGPAFVSAPGEAASPAAGGSPGAVVARSGPVTVDEAAVREMLESAEPRTRARLADDPALLNQFIRGRIARIAILAEAKAKKWDQTPDVVRKIEQARNDVIVDTFIVASAKPDAAFPSEAELQSAYEANRSKFVLARQYRLAQIFLLLPLDAPKDDDERTRKRLGEMMQQIRAGKADFADLARKNSQDTTSAGRGGELDWIGEDRLLPQMCESVSGLEKGGITEPVRTPDGWHLLKLLDTKPATLAPLAEVREQLTVLLRQQKAQENANAFIAEFLKRNPVQIDEIALSKLVQKQEGTGR